MSSPRRKLMKARKLFRKRIKIIDGRTWFCSYKYSLRYSGRPKWLVSASMCQDIYKIVRLGKRL